MSFDLQPLLEATGLTLNALGRAAGISGKAQKRYVNDGLSPRQADRLAVKFGMHPSEVWPAWFMDEIALTVDVCKKKPAPVYDADLSAVDDAWIVATDAVALLGAIEARLVAAGAVTELRQFRGLSAQEVALMLEQEQGSVPDRSQVARDVVAA